MLVELYRRFWETKIKPWALGQLEDFRKDPEISEEEYQDCIRKYQETEKVINELK